MSDWTNGEPLIATEQHVNMRWGGDPANFRCGFCGHKILAGERWCFVFTNDLMGAGGNPLACNDCIKPAEFCACASGETLQQGLRGKWQRQCAEWWAFTTGPRWWRFMRNLRAAIEQDLGR